MTSRTYKSTDASAPTLSGTNGSLVALMSAILVDGYGSQTAAGWTKPYTGTNTAVFRMGTSGNTGFYLDVLDNGPGGGGAREARMRGYEAMTAVSTGTNPFPTVAQAASGVFCRKSTTADSTARAWYAIADSSFFALFVDTGDYTAPAYSLAFSFGDFYSYKSGDLYNCAIIGRSSENSGADSADNVALLYASGTSNILTSNAAGHYVARTWTGTGASIQFCKHSSALAVGPNNSTARAPCGSPSSCITYPNGPDGALELAPIYIGHSSAVRGYLKGLWAPLHNQPCGHGDTFSGTGNMAGKTFLALNVKADQSNSNGGSTSGQIVLETSDTWS